MNLMYFSMWTLNETSLASVRVNENMACGVTQTSGRYF